MISRTERKNLRTQFALNGSHQNQSSPVKGTNLILQDCVLYANSLNQRKETLHTCLQLYKICFDSRLPQKCFTHNNFITLYCEHEQKLLCVNCIYGSAAHKSHRVVPSNNSIKSISHDNQESLKNLEEEFNRVRISEQEMIKNEKTLDEEYKRVIDTLDRQFNQMINFLQIKHQEMKDKAKLSFSRANQQNYIGREQIRWWKDYLGNLRHSLPKSSLDEQPQIYKHLVLETLQKDTLDLDKLTYMASPQQITQDFVSQAIRLRQLIEGQISYSNPIKSKPERIKMF